MSPILKRANQIEHLIFTDVETTAKDGPEHRTDQLVEVAAVRVRLADRKILDQFSTLIQPHGDHQTMQPAEGVFEDTSLAWDLGEFHTKKGHFQGVDWHGPGTMPLREALIHLAHHFFPDATFAGNNVPFDVDHYKRDFAALGIPWPKTDYHKIDLASPAIYLVMSGVTPGVSLRYTAAWAGRPAQAHRALSDCYDGIAAFWAMFDHFTGPRPMMAPDFDPSATPYPDGVLGSWALSLPVLDAGPPPGAQVTPDGAHYLDTATNTWKPVPGWKAPADIRPRLDEGGGQ